MSNQPARRFYRLNDCILVLNKGDELTAAKAIVDQLRKLAHCHRPRKAYVFLNEHRELYCYGIEHQNVQYFLTNHPNSLVGFYTGKISAEDIAEDLMVM